MQWPKAKTLYTFIIIPFLLIAIAFFFLYKEPLYIINPNVNIKDSSIVLTSFDDQFTNGHSSISIIENTNGIVNYSYTLKEGCIYPYVGVIFAKKDSSLFSIKDYNYLRVKINARKGTRVPISIMSEINGYTKRDSIFTYRNSQYISTVTPASSVLEIPISDLKTPDWWYTFNNKTENDFGNPDFSKVKTIQFGSCINLKTDIDDSITIEEVSFHFNLFLFYLLSSIFLISYFGLGFLYIYIQSGKKTITEVNFNYHKMDVENQLDIDEKLVFGFITSNYANSDLSITDVQSAIGMHERKISSIIKNKTSLTFKQFLNKLRIAEAKRLLADTNLQVSEIAFKVGYGNASHFNRVFKSSENCSPNDYRKEITDTNK